jgi:hypothetical protein
MCNFILQSDVTLAGKEAGFVEHQEEFKLFKHMDDKAWAALDVAALAPSAVGAFMLSFLLGARGRRRAAVVGGASAPKMIYTEYSSLLMANPPAGFTDAHRLAMPKKLKAALKATKCTTVGSIFFRKLYFFIHSSIFITQYQHYDASTLRRINTTTVGSMSVRFTFISLLCCSSGSVIALMTFLSVLCTLCMQISPINMQRYTLRWKVGRQSLIANLTINMHLYTLQGDGKSTLLDAFTADCVTAYLVIRRHQVGVILLACLNHCLLAVKHSPLCITFLLPLLYQAAVVAFTTHALSTSHRPAKVDVNHCFPVLSITDSLFSSFFP